MTTTNLLNRTARDAILDAAAILVPVRCAGCAEPDRAICAACERALAPEPRCRSVDGMPVWTGLEYAGVVRAVLLAYKDAGRVDAAAALARALRAAVVAAQRVGDGGEGDVGGVPLAASSGAPGSSLPPFPLPPLTSSLPSAPSPSPHPTRNAALLPVLIPSTRAAWRRRGYHPAGLVLARSRILVPPLWRALRLTRQTADQAGLSGEERSANRQGSMVASSRLRGRACLLVDDIVTTGATLAEAARAIREAGGTVVGAAAIARTPLRGG